jgi:DNA-directed RNA polymerase subunit alpha
MIQPNFVTKKAGITSHSGTFILEPLSPSFGESMGNALRRTLLSSLKGSTIVAVKIEGVSHLFSTIKGVKETALELTLNLKHVRFLAASEGTLKMKISKKGVGKIYAKDIEGEAEVVNKDAYIGEITDPKGKIEIEGIIESGIGYVSSEEQTTKEFGFISLDSSFSPVKKVSYTVEAARVGRKTNYDRLIINIDTDGSINPEEALKQSSSILALQFSHIFATDETTTQKKEGAMVSTMSSEIDKKFYDLIIDELNLPSRVVNALLRENIETVADLIKTGEEKLVVFKGLGRKSIELIKEELKKLGVEWK